MVNLVIVSHSSRLGEGVGELARQMLMSDSCKIAIAAGIDVPFFCKRIKRSNATIHTKYGTRQYRTICPISL